MEACTRKMSSGFLKIIFMLRQKEELKQIKQKLISYLFGIHLQRKAIKIYLVFCIPVREQLPNRFFYKIFPNQ